MLPRRTDVLVVGAGLIGVAVAARLASAGLDVCVVDRAGPAAGTSSAGEGNLLVSDKLPGPELGLALRGLALWERLAARSEGAFEFDRKGGLVVAHEAGELAALSELARAQRAEGVRVEMVDGDRLVELEPALSPALVGGALYHQDCQIQPMLAVAFHLRELAHLGGRFVREAEVLGGRRSRGDTAMSVLTTKGTVSVGRCVVNAAGPWAAEVARRLGGEARVQPRRGHVLVTEPLPPLVRRKVYEAGYVGSIHEQGARACSSVVEATASGTMLLGSSRELVGFSTRTDMEVVAAVAARAIALAPVLAGARLMRVYTGFRPVTPDRLPIIGPDPAVPGLVHAGGHEGAGVGLAEVTAELVEAIVLGHRSPLDLAPFAADRFAGPHVVEDPSDDEPPPGWTPAWAPRSPADPGPEGGEEGPPTARAPRFTFDGRDLVAPAGMTLAGALLENGEVSWRSPRQGGQRGGVFCGIGTCFDCLVDVNDRRAVRACLTVVRDGDQVRSSASVGPGAAHSDPAARPVAASDADADVAVVGAGPAGMAAALAAAGRRTRVLLIDSSPLLGGQYFRQPLSAVNRPAGGALPPRFLRIQDQPDVTLLLGREVWSASAERSGFTLRLAAGEPGVARCRALVLATGASELVLPFPGWELAGVVSAGAAQALLKSQHVVVGRRVVVAGTGPFLLPVAASLSRAGAQVVVVEAARPRVDSRAAVGLLGHPGKVGEATGYALTLARHRARVLTGRAVVRCEGEGRVERVVVARLGPGWRPVAGSEETIEADAVAVSYGFVPRLELARQLGTTDLPVPDHPARRVEAGADMAAGAPGLFVAGELSGVAGAEVAELEGAIAGQAAASFLGRPDPRPPAERRRLARRLERARAFARLLPALYPVRDGLLACLGEDTTFCRCEQVRWGEILAAVAEGATTAREVRGVTRCGMGYCQGRTCGPALQMALAALTGVPLDDVGDLHKRPVAVPVDLARVAGTASR